MWGHLSSLASYVRKHAQRVGLGAGIVIVLGLVGLSIASSRQEATAAPGDPVIVAAGDIACDPSSSSFKGGNGTTSSCRQLATSNLALAANPSAVLLLGDNQYYCGGLDAYNQSYDKSWGRFKAITRPSVGNHEYLTSGGTGCTAANAGAAGYFQYFGAAAGQPGQGYYSFDVGAWHLIALNSNCGSAGGCSRTSPQGQWLAADLAAHSNTCVAAFWHIPLVSSGGRANNNTRSFWDQLYAADADLVLSAHDHLYERFAAQTPAGALDSALGLREFLIGTGGADHTSLTATAANSEVREDKTFGVMKLTLHATSYDWEFAPIAGGTFVDTGTTSCHGSGTVPDTTAPTPPSGLVATESPAGTAQLAWTAATDNVGVARYEVSRDGVVIGSSTTTTLADSTIAPASTYAYTVVAIDAAGNRSAASAPAALVTGAASTTLSITASADTYTRADFPTSVNGAATEIIADGSPIKHALMTFTVSGVGGRTVTGAVLKLTCSDPSNFGGELHRVDPTAWSEASVTWNNAPAADAAVISTLGPVVAGSTYILDLSSVVTGDGTYSFQLQSGSTDGAHYASKEVGAASAPRLVLTVA